MAGLPGDVARLIAADYETRLECPFSRAGCTFKAANVEERKRHEKDNINEHLLRVLYRQQEELQAKDAQIVNLETQLHQYVASTVAGLDGLAANMARVLPVAMVNQPKPHLNAEAAANATGCQTVLDNTVFTNANKKSFVWQIERFSQLLEAVRAGKHGGEENSPLFFSHPGGYKMCMCVFPVGLGGARGKGVGLCLRIIPGEYDDVLPWPFTGKVTLAVIDTTGEMIPVAFSLNAANDPNQAGWVRPMGTSRNPARGNAALFDFDTLPNFLQDDILTVKATIYV